MSDSGSPSSRNASSRTGSSTTRARLGRLRPREHADYDVIMDAPGPLPDVPENRVMGRPHRRLNRRPLPLPIHSFRRRDRARRPRPVTWQQSWSDLFTDRAAWEHAGSPDGFMWDFVETYPGMSHQELQPGRALDQSRPRNAEVRIEANALVLEVVFHALHVDQLLIGDPDAGILRPLDGWRDHIEPLRVPRDWDTCVITKGEFR